MRIVVPKFDNECSLCKEDATFFTEPHDLTECFEFLRERVECLEAANLSLMVRLTRLESIEASNRNA